MKRLQIDLPDKFWAEIERRADGVGKRRVVLEAMSKAWGWPTDELPMDQRRRGSERHDDRVERGWHEGEV